MTRQIDPKARGRARSDEDKALVREALIAAGRTLFSREDPATVSLRRIAAAAGYTPGAVYRYFKDQQELFAYIRAHDMQQAAERLARVGARTRDPVLRTRRLFQATVDYWLSHIDEFLVLFPPPSAAPIDVSGGTVPFGRSPVVQRMLAIYYDTVQAMFDSLPRAPLPSRLAADTLLASVHGTLVFPLMTSTMAWSDRRRMARLLIDTVVDAWAAQGRAPLEQSQIEG